MFPSPTMCTFQSASRDMLSSQELGMYHGCYMHDDQMLCRPLQGSQPPRSASRPIQPPSPPAASLRAGGLQTVDLLLEQACTLITEHADSTKPTQHCTCVSCIVVGHPKTGSIWIAWCVLDRSAGCCTGTSPQTPSGSRRTPPLPKSWAAGRAAPVLLSPKHQLHASSRLPSQQPGRVGLWSLPFTSAAE